MKARTLARVGAAALTLSTLTACSPWQRWMVTSGPTADVDLSRASRYDGQGEGAMGGYAGDTVFLDLAGLDRFAVLYGAPARQWALDHEYGHRAAVRLGLGYPLATDPPGMGGLFGQERAAQCVAEAVEGNGPPAVFTDPAHGYWDCPDGLAASVRRTMQRKGML